jgi:hypothetical protein
VEVEVSICFEALGTRENKWVKLTGAGFSLIRKETVGLETHAWWR